MSVEGRVRARFGATQPMAGQATGAAPVGQQFAALCYRTRRRKTEILLITSRDTGRWILPKGWQVAGRGAADSAAVEAWEEAGVQGTAADQPLGTFSYHKLLSPRHALPCEVQVFALRVERLANDYPERGQRRRKWFSPKKAALKVAEPELAQLLAGFVAPPAGA